MLGQKIKCFNDHTAVSLDKLVRPNNFYRHLEAKLDLSFVREFVKEIYSTSIGRPVHKSGRVLQIAIGHAIR